jgi:hypothetical protein
MEQISVTNPVGRAIEHVRRVLFNPFDIGKWFVIGFCAWLAPLGESGGSGGGNFNNSTRNGGDVHQQFEHARSYVLENLAWIVPLGIFIFALVVILMIVFTWLNSRGKFMFLHCVALNRAEIAEPWKKYEAQANSLFWFRLALLGIGMVLTLPLLVFMAMVAFPMFRNESWNFAGIMILVGLFLACFLINLIFLLIRKFTTDFVVPIMYLRGCRCMEGWREFRQQLLRVHVGNFALYLLFQIVIGLVTGAMIFAVIIITCCIAGCLLALPYLGAVLLLPVTMFKRAYSLYYLAQYGPSYNVFPPPATTP